MNLKPKLRRFPFRHFLFLFVIAVLWSPAFTVHAIQFKRDSRPAQGLTEEHIVPPYVDGYCGRIGRPNDASLEIAANAYIQLVGNRTPATSSKLLVDDYYNRGGKFSENRRTADQHTNPVWLRMSLLERAKVIYQNYVRLMVAHGDTSGLSPATLTCKTVVESCMRPQDEAPGRKSTAAGLAQATKTTIRGLFRTSPWFRSKVQGFENIRDPDTYRTEMAKSILAQQEIGWAIMVMKSKELRTNSEHRILKFYLGSKSKSANSAYANRILRCSECIQDQGNVISTSCLNRARNSCSVPGAR